MDSQKKFYLGSFIGQMAVNLNDRFRPQQSYSDVSQKFVVIPPFYPDNRQIPMRERFKDHNLICLLVDKQEEYDLTHINHRNKMRYFKDPYTNEIDERIVYGELINRFNEIWTFLLYAQYAYLEAENIVESPQSRQNYLEYIQTFMIPVKVDVYLTQKAIDDSFELKIRNYGIRYNSKDKSQKQKVNFHPQRKQEMDIEILRFGRLSLLVMFDMMLLQKKTQALIKSKKQLDIFFKTLRIFYQSRQRSEIKKIGLPIKLICDSDHKKSYYLQSILNIKKNNQRNLIWGVHYKVDPMNHVCIQQNSQTFITFSKVIELLGFNNMVHSEIQKIIDLVPADVSQHLKFRCLTRNQDKIYQELQQFEMLYQQSKETLCQWMFSLNLQSSVDLDQILNALFQSQPSILVSLLGAHLQPIEILQLKEYVDTSNKFFSQINYLRNQIFINRQIVILHNIDDEVEAEQNYKDNLHEILVKESNNNQHQIQEEEQEEVIEEEKNNIFNSQVEGLIAHETPKKMTSQLKHYQQEALSWMLYREGQITRNQAYNITYRNEDINSKLSAEEMRIQDPDTPQKADIIKAMDKDNPQQDSNTKYIVNEDKKLSPLWDKIELLNGQLLYVNTFTGKLSMQFQESKPTKGGILADEMGLGKTVMALSLIHESKILQERDANMAGTLVIVPKSVLAQWKSEIYAHSVPNSISVHEYYDLPSRNKNIDLRQVDIVLSTYAIMGSDYLIHKQNRPHEKSNDSNGQNNSFDQQESSMLSKEDDKNNYSEDDEVTKVNKSKSVPPKVISMIYVQKNKKFYRKKKNNQNNLFDYKWNRIILDEAHNIKTRGTVQSKAAFAIDSVNRWCMTGTPIQNKYDDLFTLISFLRVETFSEYFWWNTYINKENDKDRDNILQAILRPIMLRRTKQAHDKDGKQIIELEQADEQIIWVDLSTQEKYLYEKLFQGTKKFFRKLDQQQEVGQKFVHVFQIIAKLRMMCDHPYLVLKSYDNISVLLKKHIQLEGVEALLESLQQFLGNTESKQIELTPAYKAELIKQIQEGEHDMCKICLEEEIIMFAISRCGHVYCRNCFVSSINKQQLCPSCRRKLALTDLLDYEKINSTQENENQIIIDQPSSKMQAILKEILYLKSIREKCLVFTQWISMINLLQKLFEANDIQFCVITGAMSVKQRTDTIKKFDQFSSLTVLLLSLKATSTGLNLTMANHVYIVDPWWNPAIEDQAIGRAHRIGQLRKVQVKRFLCKNTIEEKIIKLHQKKRQMANNVIVLSEKERKKQEIQQYRFLFED